MVTQPLKRSESAPGLLVQDVTPPEQDLLYEDLVPTRDRLTNGQLRSHDVYIGRGCEKLGLSKSKWCNPFHITMGQSRKVVFRSFRCMLGSIWHTKYTGWQAAGCCQLYKENCLLHDFAKETTLC